MVVFFCVRYACSIPLWQEKWVMISHLSFPHQTRPYICFRSKLALFRYTVWFWRKLTHFVFIWRRAARNNAKLTNVRWVFVHLQFILETVWSCLPRLYVAIVSRVKWLHFLACFKIRRFHTISFTKAPPSKTALSRNNIPPLIDLLWKRAMSLSCIIHSRIKMILPWPWDEDHKSATEFPSSRQKALRRVA